MYRDDLVDYLEALLNTQRCEDYCPNGLQVEGGETIQSIVTGVTASQALLEAAIEKKADAILVHHGYFWRGESPVVVGLKRQRLQLLLQHNINLFAYHLPLDKHRELGNNAQLAKQLGLTVTGQLTENPVADLIWVGELAEPVQGEAWAAQIAEQLGRVPTHIPADRPIKTVAWCTGAAQNFIEQAAQQGIDAYLSGEISEPTTHIAREMNIHYFAAGHHATERYGIKALGEHLAGQFNLQHTFIDIDNPA